MPYNATFTVERVGKW